MSNVLVYSGPGVSSSALSHTLKTLRLLLPSYDVQCINSQSLALDPWAANTSLFVLPGGRDLPYVDKLSTSHQASSSSLPSRADQKVKEYVQERGGNFLGICAGAYYASSMCEFEKGNAVMEVIGERRALQFFPGTCRGTVYPGFVYESDKGARMVELQAEGQGECSRYTTYYNGGGAFLDAERYQSQGVEILARYSAEEGTSTQSDKENSIRADFINQAAVIRCKVGKGKALLFGTHPEFPLSVRERPSQLSGAPETIPPDPLVKLEKRRLETFGQYLQALGLEVKLPSSEQEGQQGARDPRLTPITMTARHPQMVADVIQGLQSIASSSRETLPSLAAAEGEAGHVLAISDTNDTMHFYRDSQAATLFRTCAQASYAAYTSPVVTSNADEARAGDVDEIEVDLNKVPKYVLAVMGADEAEAQLTPHWDAWAFYAFAEESRRRIKQSVQGSWAAAGSTSGGPNWGTDAEEVRLADVSTYAEVVTSTQTMLDKNYKFLTHLPSGFTSFATHQVSGRGRGKNAWISPLGCLQFSTLLHFSPSILTRSGTGGIVFVQYLAGLAIVESVRGGMLGQEYAVIGEKIRIKWPNDVYAEVGAASDEEGERKGTFTYRERRLAKMAGVLVNSQFAGTQLSLVVGCGINTLNPRPTTSLSDLIHAHNSTVATPADRLAPVSQEQFAGAIIATFERMWNTFVSAGGSFEPFIDAYRRAWLHSDQVTMLSDTTPPTPVKIVGITSDFGLLRSTPSLESNVGSQSKGAWASSKEQGRWIDLQPDGNSFDMLQNLIRRKE